ncbi:MAG: hypothetical protein H6Q75_193 [Firmicutes bacterium]|nr:hypothetical protein [Bacillota bacterium]
MTAEQIARINELARKSRNEGLTEDEKTEQATLRRAYIDAIKGQIKTVLDATKENQHQADCTCGCHHKH